MTLCVYTDTVATETVWQRLTKEERRQFETMLRDGSLASLIELWEPWWTIKVSHNKFCPYILCCLDMFTDLLLGCYFVYVNN